MNKVDEEFDRIVHKDIKEEQPKDAIKSINRTMDTLAEHITKCINEGKATENEIAELTKALAELVTARAEIC